ncbi:hypothetical protein [Clavibacter californiensis]|uniref:Lipoprotein n=1 Tax=Clavibacter californiensis TaxID=1401995 RepID=A0ABX9N8Z6_9MICO|nr:hypothetical protein [Clavibacter californiensis]RII94563.1 hypothetical protein DZF98_01200 [Clavibacter californiensis]UKF78901.1 hypothetical protein FGD68_08755 [Clavibacter californiensis]
MTRALPALPALLIAATLALCGCSTEAAPEPAALAPATSAPAADSEISTAAQALVGGSVTAATETEPGRLKLDTTIVDPRGDDGSPEALEALALCEQAKAIPGVTDVSVMEADGTHFVLAGHPTNGEDCTEV